MDIGWILTGAAIVIAGWGARSAFTSWQLAHHRRTWGQWGHLALLLVFSALGLYLLFSLGSAIVAGHT